MTQDDFMIDFYNEDDTVKVNARELQKLIMTKESLERQITIVEKSNEILRSNLETLRALRDSEKANDVMVQLDVRA